ncbi:secreted protein, partial [gut metagenome]
MKHITNFFILFFTFLLFSCNSEENISYITDNDYLNQNNIQDVVHIYCTTCVSDSTYDSTTDEVLIHGVRNDKFWFAVFKEDT